MGSARRTKQRLTGAASVVLILGAAIFIYGVVAAITAAASAFVLIAMGVVILGIGAAVEAAGRSLREDLSEDR